MIVDLHAVRPARLAAALSAGELAEPVRDLRPYLRGARREEIPNGIRLVVTHDVATIALLADEIRALANTWPFLSFRLLADAPACWVEVTGDGPASDVARVVFSELGA
ncbi:MAG: hypothetical protein U0807_06310 [Candidatus Binatia bacterium]